MIEGENLSDIVEAVPTYRSLLLHLDPLKAEHAKLPEALSRLAGAATSPQARCRRRWRVPVIYGGEFGMAVIRIGYGNCRRPVSFA